MEALLQEYGSDSDSREDINNDSRCSDAVDTKAVVGVEARSQRPQVQEVQPRRLKVPQIRRTSHCTRQPCVVPDRTLHCYRLPGADALLAGFKGSGGNEEAHSYVISSTAPAVVAHSSPVWPAARSELDKPGGQSPQARSW